MECKKVIEDFEDAPSISNKTDAEVQGISPNAASSECAPTADFVAGAAVVVPMVLQCPGSAAGKPTRAFWDPGNTSPIKDYPRLTQVDIPQINFTTGEPIYVKDFYAAIDLIDVALGKQPYPLPGWLRGVMAELVASITVPDPGIRCSPTQPFVPQVLNRPGAAAVGNRPGPFGTALALETPPRPWDLWFDLLRVTNLMQVDGATPDVAPPTAPKDGQVLRRCATRSGCAAGGSREGLWDQSLKFKDSPSLIQVVVALSSAQKQLIEKNRADAIAKKQKKQLQDAAMACYIHDINAKAPVAEADHDAMQATHAKCGAIPVMAFPDLEGRYTSSRMQIGSGARRMHKFKIPGMKCGTLG